MLSKEETVIIGTLVNSLAKDTSEVTAKLFVENNTTEEQRKLFLSALDYYFPNSDNDNTEPIEATKEILRSKFALLKEDSVDGVDETATKETVQEN